MEEVFAAVGKAVIAAQVFETALVPVLELYKIHTEPGRLARTKGHIAPGAFKEPIKNIVKFLEARDGLDPELGQRLVAYSENRHTLVHRWLYENGWPSESPELQAQLIALASKVEQEAWDLSQAFSNYILRWAEPAWATDNLSEYQSRMQEIFKRAHRQE
jgi:hypothetical protein